MTWFRCSVWGWVLAGALMGGCEHADPLDANQLEPTLASIQEHVFDTNCALSGCHLGGGTGLPGSMDLSAGQAFANVVGVRSQERPALFRVEPGNPEGSYLLMKIVGAPGIAGERMPRGRDPLSSEQIAAIRQWIADGALDNGAEEPRRSPNR